MVLGGTDARGTEASRRRDAKWIGLHFGRRFCRQLPLVFSGSRPGRLRSSAGAFSFLWPSHHASGRLLPGRRRPQSKDSSRGVLGCMDARGVEASRRRDARHVSLHLVHCRSARPSLLSWVVKSDRNSIGGKVSDGQFQSAVQDLRRRFRRWRLLAIPALLAVLAYLVLLVCYWSGQISKERAAEAALVLLLLTWLSLIPMAVGLIHIAAWRCPACSASALPAPVLWGRRPLQWWMLLPVTPRACLVCGVPFGPSDKVGPFVESPQVSVGRSRRSRDRNQGSCSGQVKNE
jgi:hypothetical protein